MKANELMIGDWVRGFLPDTNSQIVGIINEHRVAIIGGGASMEISNEDIQPIPITPEILEKNEFVYNDLPFVQGWEQFGLLLYLGGDGFHVNCGQNISLRLGYVHELQHALRLCGIDKEIEI